MANVFKTEVSLYNGVNGPGRLITLDQAHRAIECGKTSFMDLVESTQYARVVAQTDKEAYKTYKTKQPAITVSGVFGNGNGAHHMKYLRRVNPLVVIDFDGADAGEIMPALIQNPATVMCFASYTGVKAIVAIDPLPETEQFFSAYSTVVEYYSEYGDIDTSGSNLNRLCYLPADPMVFRNDNPLPIRWEYDPDLKPEKTKNVTYYNLTELNEIDADLDKYDLSVLEYLPDYWCDDYEFWIRIALAIKGEGLPFSVLDEFSRRSASYDHDSNVKLWDNLRIRKTGKRFTWASIVYHAKQHGYGSDIVVDDKCCEDQRIIKKGRLYYIICRTCKTERLYNED